MPGITVFEMNAMLQSSLLTGTVYLALWQGNPGPNGAGGAEIGASEYHRQAITFNAPTQGSTSNSNVVTFPTPTTDWGLVDNWAIMTALTAGTMLYYGEFDSPQTVEPGGLAAVVEAGGIQVQIG